MVKIDINDIYKRYKLFSRPSFVEGMGRLFDLSSSLQQYNCYDTPEETDAYQLRSDFEVVGENLRKAIQEYKEKYGKT